MSSRVTDKQLQAVVDRINTMTSSPLEPWTKDASGKLMANIGCYHLDYAYGGVALHRMQSEGGGVIDVLQAGYSTKRECLHLLFAFIRGLEQAGGGAP